LYVYYPGVYPAIQDVVEPSLRGTAMAVYFCAMYLLGAAQGPLVTGWISDHFAGRAAAEHGLAPDDKLARALGLHQAMYLVPVLAVLLVLVLFAASRTVANDHRKLQEWMKTGQ